MLQKELYGNIIYTARGFSGGQVYGWGCEKQ